MEICTCLRCTAIWLTTLLVEGRDNVDTLDMPKAPEVGAFGAALPPGAAIKHADDEIALYRAAVRIDDVISFYEAVYGATPDIEVAVHREATPNSVTLTPGPKCVDAAFGMITATAVPKQQRQVDVVVTKREADADAGYRTSNPWKAPK